jgi:hypothetical protein
MAGAEERVRKGHEGRRCAQGIYAVTPRQNPRCCTAALALLAGGCVGFTSPKDEPGSPLLPESPDASTGPVPDAGRQDVVRAEARSLDAMGAAVAPAVSVQLRFVHAEGTERAARYDLYVVGDVTPVFTDVAFGAATDYRAATIPRSGARFEVRLAGAGPRTPARYASPPLEEVSAASKITVAGARRVLPLVEAFAPAAEGTVRLRFARSDGASDGVLRVYTSAGAHLAAVPPQADSAPEGAVLEAPRGQEQLARVSLGVPHVAGSSFFHLPPSQLPSGSGVLVFIVAARGPVGAPDLLVVPAMGMTAVAEAQQQEPVVSLVHGCPDLERATFVIRDTVGGHLLAVVGQQAAQSTRALAVQVRVPKMREVSIVVQRSGADPASPHGTALVSTKRTFREHTEQVVILTGLAQPGSPDQALRLLAHEFPPAPQCGKREFQIVHAAPGLPAAEPIGLTSQGDARSLAPGIGFGATLNEWTQAPPDINALAVRLSDGKVVRSFQPAFSSCRSLHVLLAKPSGMGTEPVVEFVEAFGRSSGAP